MALKKDALRATVADDSRDLVKASAEPRGTMRTYQVKFSPSVLERFRAHCQGKALSLSAGIRLAVAEYMEHEGLR